MEILKEDFASGKHARVSLVRLMNRELLVWKRPHDDSKAHRMSFRKTIQRAKVWCDLGLSTMTVRWHDDNRSLLCSYVPGVTALDRIRQSGFWTTRTYQRERQALERFFRHAATQHAYIADINPRNLIFDGTRWQMVDSGSIRFRASTESTLRKYQKYLLTRWARHIPPAELTSFQMFVHALTLPELGASVLLMPATARPR